MELDETQRLLKWAEEVALKATHDALESPRIEDRGEPDANLLCTDCAVTVDPDDGPQCSYCKQAERYA